MRPVTEDELQAYVDDALTPERKGDVEAYLARHTDIATRIASYRLQASAMRKSLKAAADEPVPSRFDLRRIAASHRRPVRRWRMPSVAAVMLLFGIATGWLARDYSTPPPEGVLALAQEASTSFASYVLEDVGTEDGVIGDTSLLSISAAKAVGRPMNIPDLSKAGYRIIGGRSISTVHGLGFLVIYRANDGRYLTMMMRPMKVDQNRPMVEHADGTVNGWAWASGGMGFSLVGGNPLEELHPIADEIRIQMGT